jgi:hypothetical protein
MQIPMKRLLTVQGRVYDSASRRAIPKARVHIDVDGMQQSVTTGVDGGFTARVTAGAAEIDVDANGFLEQSLRRTVSSDASRIDIPLQRGANLNGTVINVVTGRPVSGATVRVDSHDGSDWTDSSGQFSVGPIPPTLATVRVSAPGFEDNSFRGQPGPGNFRVMLSPELAADEVRIVLTWGEYPRDLDAYLVGPDARVFHRDRQQGPARLDVDEKERGRGPETITLKGGNGSYNYYVVDNANHGRARGEGLGESAARVRVFRKGKPMETYSIPGRPSGSVWHALTIDSRGLRITRPTGNVFAAKVPEN